MKSTICLSGQVALVTGGTRGLGRVVAQRLAEAGCIVVVCGRNAPDTLPDGISFRPCDIRNAGEAESLVNGVIADLGQLDILVNNAGGSPEVPVTDASVRFLDAILKLNLHAPLYLAKAAHAHMAPRKSGSIVNIASVSGIRPSPGTVAYGAAKAGLLSMTKSLAQEWGCDQVRVNAIIVGLAETETAEATYGDATAQALVAASLPLGRMARGDDVADAVLYLSSSLASYVSGAHLEVSGGGERPVFLDLVKGR